MKKLTLFNLFTVVLLQIVTIISNFIIPNLIINTFGSEANGLIATLTQLLNFVALVEGGLNGVIMANLYGPLVRKDYDKLSSIIKTSQRMFRKISIVFIGYTLALTVIFPLFFKSSFSWSYVSSMTIILSLKLFIQYCFSFTYKNLLNADKKIYYVSLVQAGLVTAETLATIIIVNVIPDLHVLKFISALVFISQPILYGLFVRKHYKINNKAKKDNDLLKERWNGLAINTAAFIHGNTDVAIISLFKGLQMASVYNVYSLVSTGLKTISQSFWKALGPSIGKIYALGDEKLLRERFDTFEFITFYTTFFLFSEAALLVTPFVQLYTNGITDAEYYQPVFGIIMIVAEGIYILREPYVNMAYTANRFKDIRKHAVIEALLNIGVSLVLVPWMGIAGVAIGTLFAMTYRTVFQILYLRNHLINRPFRIFMKRISLFIIPTILVSLLCAKLFPFEEQTVVSWIVHAIVYGLMFLVAYTAVSILFFKREIKNLIGYIKQE